MNYLLTAAANADHLDWFFWTGLVAAICITIFCLPALVNIVKTKNTSGVSITMYIIYCVGCTFFFISGVGMACKNQLSGGLPMGISNGIAAVFGFIILFLKFRNKSWCKKYGINEMELAKDYYKYQKLAREEKAAKKAKKAQQKASQAKQDKENIG